jgi:hypothetical protein
MPLFKNKHLQIKVANDSDTPSITNLDQPTIVNATEIHGLVKDLAITGAVLTVGIIGASAYFKTMGQIAVNLTNPLNYK